MKRLLPFLILIAGCSSPAHKPVSIHDVPKLKPAAVIPNAGTPIQPIVISTLALYDPSFSNRWSSIQRSEDLVHWRTIGSNYYGLPAKTNGWVLNASNNMPVGFFRAMKQAGYLK